VTTTVEVGGSAAERLRRAIAGQTAEMDRLEQEVRLGNDPECVHDMRVAVRRLRSILRSARPMLERRWVEELRAELDWIGGRLGAVRDLDVLSQELHAQAETLNGGDAALAAELLRPLRIEREQGRVSLVDALSDERYTRLREMLDAASRSLPTLRDDVQLDELAAREFKRLRKRGKPDPADSNGALHKRRIRAKRVRYAAELIDKSERPKAARFVKEAKRFQDLLGDHQDAVVARRHLRRLARTAGRAGAGVAAGRLIQLQEQRIEDARRRLPKAWKRLMKRGRAAWAA
jgi:CHAD domain-containing protein